MKASSRRALLTAATAMPLVGMAAQQHPDAALLALCAEHTELERRKVAIWHSYPSTLNFDQEEALDKIRTAPLTERQGEIIDLLCAMEAKSAEGLLAKMAWLAGFDPSVTDASDCDGTVAERMMPGIFRNGLALQAAAKA